MSKNINPAKYIVVLGTTYSGSGAVQDYLAERGDLHDPLCGSEYLLPQAPNGLMALEAAAGKAFHYAMGDYALIQFGKLAEKLACSPRWNPYGENYDARLPGFLPAIQKFISDVTIARMPMNLEWHKMMESDWRRFIARLQARLGFQKQAKPTNILAPAEDLIVAAQILHDQIFQASVHKRVLLNQAGSGWNPVESTKYFDSRKVVLVTRDPRDQFAELKQYKKARGVGEFIKWFHAMKKRIDAVDDKLVLKLSFENFVAEHGISVEHVCEHFDLDITVPSAYDASSSAKNIGKYKVWLSNYEIDQIEAALFQ